MFILLTCLLFCKYKFFLLVDDNDAGFEPMDDIPVEEGRDENKVS